MDSFGLLLDRSNSLYYPGEFLTGKIVVKLNKKVRINKIKILLNGIGNFGWLENQASSDDTKYVHSNKNYIYLSLVLLEKKSIDAGSHQFPFSIKLPDHLPSSIQTNYGSIDYSLKAILDLPWCLKKCIQKELLIYSNVDLNCFYGLKTLSVCKNSKFSFLNDNNIQAHLTVMKPGFVPGEPIIFSTFIKNQTSHSLKNAKINLIQNCKFCIDNQSKEIKKKISTIDYGKCIEKNSVLRWTCSEWILPQTCPSSIDQSDLAQISYELELKLEKWLYFKNKKIKIPIIVGTIPLRK